MDTLINLDNQLMHLPAGLVVMFFAIAIGYVLKTAGFFPNNRIPLVIVCLTAVVFPVVQLCAQLTDNLPHPWLNIPINVLIGVIIGFIAWAFHYQILKRFVDPRLFNDDGSTKFFTKPKPPASPAQPPQP